jgi:polyisoprenoid-binding protein YceI
MRCSGAMRLRTVTPILVALALSSSAALSANPAAREAVIELDPASTQIDFVLKGFPHTTSGWFKLKSGVIRIDPETGRADGKIVVDAASGATGIGMRDSEMRNSILEVQRYPEISFAPRQVRGQPLARGAFKLSLSGILFIHGGPHDVTMEVAINRHGNDFTATTRLTIPYVAWGMKNPSLLFLTVSDDVAIEASTAGHVTWSIAPR